MIDFQEIPTKVISIKVRPKAERMVKKRHPWVFEDSIVKQNVEGNSGDVVVIYDNKKNKFLACGLFDADSPIKIKLLQFGKPAKLDFQFFKNRINEIY